MRSLTVIEYDIVVDSMGKYALKAEKHKTIKDVTA